MKTSSNVDVEAVVLAREPDVTSIFTEAQKLELIQLKLYFPFRICWGAVKAETGEFVCGADYNRRKLNKKLRDGWLVFEARK